MPQLLNEEMSFHAITKDVIDYVRSQIDAGRLFQTRGPLTVKDWLPNVVLVDGSSSIIIPRNV